MSDGHYFSPSPALFPPPKPSMSPPTAPPPIPPYPHPTGTPTPRATTYGCVQQRSRGAFHKDSSVNGIPGVCSVHNSHSSPRQSYPGGLHSSHLSQQLPPGLSFISPLTPPQVFVSNPDGSPASGVLVRCQDHKVYTSPSGVATLTINTDAQLKQLPIQVPIRWGRGGGVV